ncbi:DUF4136 domain-containing protein [Agaribacterium sp. ZY112]|uniref:DUF4136 domain-containing protein n=1 Tax=Agaribacterium sp. ZY112 TaxID=3233574 RepID=UPI0035251B8F
MNSLKFALVSLLMVLLTACSNAPRIHSNTEPDWNFADYKSFNFVPNAGPEEAEKYDSFTLRYLKDAIVKEMAARGVKQVEEGGDVMVNFYIHTKEKVSTTSSPSMSMGYYGYRGRYGYSYGMGYGTDTTVRQYTEGTLNIDVVDTKENKLVWEGIAIGTLRESDKGDVKNVTYDTVSRIFRKYPVPAPASAK